MASTVDDRCNLHPRLLSADEEGADEGESDVDIVEVIVAESWDAWLEVDHRPEMKPIFEGFLRMAKDDTVTTFYGSKIEPKDG